MNHLNEEPCLDANLIDQYTLYYNSYLDADYMLEEYEKNLCSYIAKQNNGKTMEYYTYDSFENSKITIMSYRTNMVIYEVNITKLDHHRYQVKIYLIDLRKEEKNIEFMEIKQIIKDTKKDVIILNEYFNQLKVEKEINLENKIEKFMNRDKYNK